MTRSVSAGIRVIRPIVAAKVSNPSTGKSECLYALVDSGADRDYLSSRVRDRLGLEKRESLINLKTVGSQSVGVREITDLELQSMDGSYKAQIMDALVGDFPNSTNDVIPSKHDWSGIKHLENKPFIDLDAQVEMIISSAHGVAYAPKEKPETGERDQPIAINCAFGWRVEGPNGRKRGTRDEPSIHFFSAEDKELRESIERIFHMDFPKEKYDSDNLSREARYALEQLEKSVKWNPEKGKYSAGLPYKYGREKTAEILNSVDSKSTAQRRAWSLKRSMEKIPPKKDKGFSEMKKFLDTGKARPLSKEEEQEQEKSGKPVWHLPCHLVYQHGKYRFCHDGRAATRGICLNDLLIGDLNLMVPILDPINNMRSYLYSFSTDIEGFFHQILLDEEDQGVFRFYWYPNEDMEELEMFLFLAFIFGSSCSPTVTSFVMKHHSKLMREKFSKEVCDIISRYFYVDDGSGGSNSLEGCKRLMRELEEAMKEGGFSLGKWKFSHQELAEGKEQEDDGKEKKILGIVWDTKTDEFKVSIDLEKFEAEADTPRLVVTQQASLFDPIGMIAPFMLLGRQWTQEAMTDEWGWDLQLSDRVKEGFNEWTRSIIQLRDIAIPRPWDSPQTVNGEEQLHIFSDACKTGFGAVVYRRAIGVDGSIRVSFLNGKSHVTPKNTSRAGFHGSIPRLELSAAVKSVDLLKSIQSSMMERFTDIWLWSDSNCVINQIRDRSKNYKTYVANRLSKIHKGSDERDWHFVDGELNPADLCSRGIRAHEKEKWRTYHYGPEFLWEKQKDWPKMKLTEPEEAVMNLCIVEDDTVTPTEEEEKWLWRHQVFSKFSGWHKKMRMMSTIKSILKKWMIRTRLRCISRSRKGNLSCRNCRNCRARDKAMDECEGEKWKDIIETETEVWRSVQTKYFLREIRNVKEKGIETPNSRKEMSKRDSPLLPHNPFLGKDGLLRVGSRLVFADMSELTKFPVLLPKDDQNVSDYIRHIHEKEFHAGNKHVLCTLRTRVWILQGLQATKKVIDRCVKCQRNKKRACEQKMAPLPGNRISCTAPFYHCGIDIMGPFLCKLNGRANHKVYVAVFTCFESRSVHAEVVFNLTADAAINAIVRFNARRPGLNSLYSDRGTNFVAANTILKKELEEVNAKVSPELAKRGIVWQFNPPHSPHRGGAWERVVGLFKKAIAVITAGDVIHYDTFATAITEAEGILNRRPLTQISTDSKDSEALTPNHLLSPATMHLKDQPSVVAECAEEKETMQKSWRRAQARINAFWNVFRSDYLSLLHSRAKWRTSKENLKKDDLVIIVDETIRRHDWKLGRIASTLQSDDHVRQVAVRRGDGKIVERDRTKLVKLELD